MKKCFTDPHYWKNTALRRSREKIGWWKQNQKGQFLFESRPLSFGHLILKVFRQDEGMCGKEFFMVNFSHLLLLFRGMF
jgi:hypothetical protein